MKKRIPTLLVLLFLLSGLLQAKESAPSAINCDVSLTTGLGSLTVDGLDAPIEIVKVFDTHWQIIYECNSNCADQIELNDLSAGKYYVRVNTYSAAWEELCNSGIMEVEVRDGSVKDYCEGVRIEGGPNGIAVTGVNAPWHRIQIRPTNSMNMMEVCNDDCSDPQLISGLGAGTYVVIVDQGDRGGDNYCLVEFMATIGDGSNAGGGDNTGGDSNAGGGDNTGSDSNAGGDSNTGGDSNAGGGGIGTGYCATLSVTGGDGAINITGLTAPINRVRYKVEGTSDYSEVCSSTCLPSHPLVGIAAGNYTILINQSDADGTNACESTFSVSVAAPSINYCSDVRFEVGANSVSVFGAMAPWQQIQYYYEQDNSYTDVCNDDCGNPHIISDLAPGNYKFLIDLREFSGENYCFVETDIVITGEAIGGTNGSGGEGGNNNGTGSTGTDYCSTLQVSGGNGAIDISGLNAPYSKVQYRLEGSMMYSDVCVGDCLPSHPIVGVAAGNYFVKITQRDANGGNACEREFSATVSASSINYCADVRFEVSANSVSVFGAMAPWQQIQYYYEQDNSYTDVCNDDCGNPHIISDLAPGNYIFLIDLREFSGENYCFVEEGNNGGGNNGGGNDGGGNNGGGNDGGGNTVCAEREVTNTTSCDFGEYGIFLNTSTEGLSQFSDLIEASFIEYDNGTALLKGTLVNRDDDWVRFEIEALFSGRTTVAGADSPKEHTCGRPQDLSSFYYYTSYNGTITGIENAEGALLEIQNTGPAFQVGFGANITENRFPQPLGGSGWFTVNLISQPNDFDLNFPAFAEGQVGDINITLSGGATACFTHQAADTRSTEFTNFNAYPYQRQVELEWATNSGYRTTKYFVEKSTDGVHYESLATLDNSTSSKEITYFEQLDLQPAIGDNYYRLKQVYADGSYDYSPSKKVNFTVDLSSTLAFPNPAQQALYMNLAAYAGEQVSITISNQYGQVLKEIKETALTSALVRIDLQEFTNGVYLVSTRVGQQQAFTQKVIVSKMY